MTLAELIEKARTVGDGFNSWQIPLKYEGRNIDITFDTVGSNDEGWVINLMIEQK